jgi:hypothetical protein
MVCYNSSFGETQHFSSRKKLNRRQSKKSSENGKRKIYLTLKNYRKVRDPKIAHLNLLEG